MKVVTGTANDKLEMVIVIRIKDRGVSALKDLGERTESEIEALTKNTNEVMADLVVAAWGLVDYSDKETPATFGEFSSDVKIAIIVFLFFNLRS